MKWHAVMTTQSKQISAHAHAHTLTHPAQQRRDREIVDRAALPAAAFRLIIEPPRCRTVGSHEPDSSEARVRTIGRRVAASSSCDPARGPRASKLPRARAAIGAAATTPTRAQVRRRRGRGGRGGTESEGGGGDWRSGAGARVVMDLVRRGRGAAKKGPVVHQWHVIVVVGGERPDGRRGMGRVSLGCKFLRPRAKEQSTLSERFPRSRRRRQIFSIV